MLVLQLALAGAGADHDHHLGHGAEGLNLASARALAAGLTFFGLGGLLGLSMGLWSIFALLIGVVLGGSAMFATAAVVRSLGRLEHDGTLVLSRAIGQSGVVYLSIPGERAGLGKVHVNVQDRLVECAAVTPDRALPTGAAVLVVDIEEPDTLVVVPNPVLLEESNESL